MGTPKEILEHSKDYKPGAWANYSEEEYMWWVRLLMKRSFHRSEQAGKVKDLTDARNYLLMWLAKFE